MKRSKTYTAGANAERAAIKAFVRRRRKTFRNRFGPGERIVAVLDDVLLWLAKRSERYNKKPKGVGK